MKIPTLAWLLPPLLLLAACGGQPARPDVAEGGGYYEDDGPADAGRVDLAAVPDAVVRDEPLHRFANRPYKVMGRSYTPQKSRRPFRQRGVASWYGRKFHGKRTANGETYDMFAMTAAHPTLPLPSFARVTRVDSGESVVVRVNDRGPFLRERIIDLSYAAAWRLGIVRAGSGEVIVETILPGATQTPVAASSPPPPAVAAPPPGGGYYLQLGAFGERSNAEARRDVLARKLGEWGERLIIRLAAGLYRLQLGPWPDADTARNIARNIERQYGAASFLVE